MMKRDVSLKPFNTFGIDVHAAQFDTFSNAQELKDCLDQAAYTSWILGGGSNILFVDDLQLCVLKNEIAGIQVLSETTDAVVIRAGAGVVWHDLVTWCIAQNLGGLENLALIPGSVGAAPIQNIGAYGGELTQTFVSLQAMRLHDRHMEEFSFDQCEFGYRDSVFKNRLKDQLCILYVDLRLFKSPHQIDISYGALQHVLTQHDITDPTIRDVYDAVIEIRSAKLPDPVKIGNAGSFFKNPIVDETEYQELRREYTQMPAFETEDHHYKIPAGWLIEQCGWKGRREGNVGCYEKQALVIVNYGGASGREVYDHAMRVKDSVKEKFNIELSTEVNVV